MLLFFTLSKDENAIFIAKKDTSKAALVVKTIIDWSLKIRAFTPDFPRHSKPSFSTISHIRDPENPESYQLKKIAQIKELERMITGCLQPIRRLCLRISTYEGLRDLQQTKPWDVVLSSNLFSQSTVSQTLCLPPQRIPDSQMR